MLSERWRARLPQVLLVIAITIYSIFLSIYLTQKYDYFRTGYFDFGEAVQTVWQASQGRFNALALGRPISIIAALPFFFYPHPETLLAFQSYVIGIGAIPVFYLARRHLQNDWLGLGFAILYLMYPPVWGVNQYEYHDLAFSITFLLFGAFFYSNGNLRGYCLSLTLALASNPFVVVIATFMGVSMLTDYHFQPKDRKILKFLWGTLITTGAFAIYLQLIPYLPYYRISSLDTQSYTLTGSTAYVNPLFAFSNLIYSITYAWPEKLLYFLALFGSVLFLPALSARKFLPGLPWLGVVVLYTPQLGAGGVGPPYEFSQWSTFLIPFIVVSTIYGFKRFLEFRIPVGLGILTPRRLMSALLLATLVLGIVAGGFSPVSKPQQLSVGDSTIPLDIDPNSPIHGIMPSPVANNSILNWFVEQIPSNYSVLTQNQIGSKLGERLANVWTFYQPSYGNVNADAILLDYNLPGLCNTCISQILASGNYYLFTSYGEGGIYLYFKNS